MQIVERGDGHPQCWQTGITVDPDHPAWRLKPIAVETVRLGPLYLLCEVVGQMARQQGWISPEDQKRYEDEKAAAEAKVAEMEAELTQARVDVEQLRGVVERHYTVASLMGKAFDEAGEELRIGHGKPGPGRPKKVIA